MAKKRRYNPHVKPTERDLEIFKYTGVLRVVTKNQIYKRFWEGRRRQTCSDRLEELVKAGYLHTREIELRGKKEQVYWIERKSSMLFDEIERAGFCIGEPAPTQIPHLLYAGEEYDELSKNHKITEYRSENDLRAEGKGRTIPEPADFAATLDSEPYLVEIDSVHYNGKRLAAKVRSLGETNKQVIWVVYSIKRFKRVMAATREYANIFVKMNGTSLT